MGTYVSFQPELVGPKSTEFSARSSVYALPPDQGPVLKPDQAAIPPLGPLGLPSAPKALIIPRPFHGIALGHDGYKGVALDGADYGQPRAGVATSELHYGLPWLKFTG